MLFIFFDYQGNGLSNNKINKFLSEEMNRYNFILNIIPTFSE